MAHAAGRLGPSGIMTAVEWDRVEATKLTGRGLPHLEVICDDFFAWFFRRGLTSAVDAVVGNPPFIRYQDFPESHRSHAFAIMRQEGLHPSRLTNSWLPFVVAATRALRCGGRLALVVPAELLQVSYAAELREYLARKYRRLTIITFRRLLFDGIQQETVLLLGERQDTLGAEVSFLELDDERDLLGLDVQASPRVPVEINHAREKWTQYYLSPEELRLVRGVEADNSFTPLGKLASVDVGIVTGRNEFFVLTHDEARAHGVLRWCLPLVGRSAQTPGLVLRREDWEALSASESRC